MTSPMGVWLTSALVLVYVSVWLLYEDPISEDSTRQPYELHEDQADFSTHPSSGIIIDQPYPNGDNIFFLETSCALNDILKIPDKDTDSVLRMTTRAACALQAAARTHPRRLIYFVHTCPVRVEALDQAPSYIIAAFRAANVRLWPVRYAQVFAGSHVESWLAKGMLQESHWPIVHTSDILRFYLVWKYGGTYIDSDMLMIRSLNGKHNFCCAESTVWVSIGIFDFGWDEVGRRFANACLDDVLNNYRPDLWAHNGPGVITRVMQKLCDTKQIIGMTSVTCGGFELMPTKYFYPVPAFNYMRIFRDREHALRYVFKLTRNSIGFHVWNNFTRLFPVNVSSKQPYAVIARSVCPGVVEALKGGIM